MKWHNIHSMNPENLGETGAQWWGIRVERRHESL